jgi:hypothetical protein
VSTISRSRRPRARPPHGEHVQAAGIGLVNICTPVSTGGLNPFPRCTRRHGSCAATVASVRSFRINCGLPRVRLPDSEVGTNGGPSSIRLFQAVAP